MQFTFPEIEQLNIKKRIEWLVFVVYVIVVSFTMFHHEMWADELHSWNISKASSSFFDLIRNTRYEGHPPVWYVILWIIAKFSHGLMYVQIVHLLIAFAAIYLLLFFSPLPTFIKVLLPFGYYFLFEYTILSRNYAPGILLAFSTCIILHKNFKYKHLAYYILIFLLSNTHLLAALLAISIHAAFIFSFIEQKKKVRTIMLHTLLGIIILLPSFYFIFPPATSEMNSHFW